MPDPTLAKPPQVPPEDLYDPVEIPRPIAVDILGQFQAIDNVARGEIYKYILCENFKDKKLQEEFLTALGVEINSEKDINLFLVRDRESQQVVMAVATVNKAIFNEAVVKYYNSEFKDKEFHLGTLEIGKFYSAQGKLEIDENGKLHLKTDNDVTLFTLAKGDGLKLTNFQGITFNSVISGNNITDSINLLGRSGLMLDIASGEQGKATTIKGTKLKFDLGAGVANQPDGTFAPSYQTLFKLQLDFE